MDERRIQKNGELLVEYSNIETKVMPIIQKCLDNMKDNGNSVNGAQVLWKGHNLQLPCVQHQVTCKTFDYKISQIRLKSCDTLASFKAVQAEVTQKDREHCMALVLVAVNKASGTHYRFILLL